MSKFIRHVYLYILAMVDMCNLVTCLYQTPIFEWCVLWKESKNGRQKDIMCSKEIARLRAPNMLTTLDSIVNISEGPKCPFNWHKNLHFDNQEDIYMSSENYQETSYNLELHLLAILC
jgi:hypothetical protein